MAKIALGLTLIVLGISAAHAQDIAGIEDCTKAAGLDKRTGCLQSNVNFLQRLVTKNTLETAQKFKAIEFEVVALKSTVTRLQRDIEQLQAAQKSPNDKKLDPK